MTISHEHLKKFQDAYKQDFGDDISPEEARAMLARLVTLYELLMRPLPENPER